MIIIRLALDNNEKRYVELRPNELSRHGEETRQECQACDSIAVYVRRVTFLEHEPPAGQASQ